MLETRIPPPIVTAIVAAAMWALSWIGPSLPIPTGLRIALSWLSALAGAAFAAPAMMAFARAKTTINPVKPEDASSVITSGIYRVTRNPMYLGLTLLLVAWAFRLDALVAFLGPAAFILYITYFQIIPEERALAMKFGETYEAYRRNVRRWL